MVNGVRVLVTLKSGVEIDKSSGDGTKNNPYKLVQKRFVYTKILEFINSHVKLSIILDKLVKESLKLCMYFQ